MKRAGQQGLVGACFALLGLAGCAAAMAQPAAPQPMACLTQAAATVSPGAWDTARAYFSSLSIGETPQDKARLIRLRAAIVQLEGAKQQLIDVIDDYMRTVPADAVANNDAGLARVPPLLQEIESITRSLRALAAASNLYAAEPAFRQLVLNVDSKRAGPLCAPPPSPPSRRQAVAVQAAALAPPSKDALRPMLGDLKAELSAIVRAEDALAAYIKRLQ